MRTANKLLLSFVALVVLLMLFSDIVLWANFKKGRNGDDDLVIKKRDDNIALQPVNVLYITGVSHQVTITPGNQPIIVLGGDTTGRFTYVQKSDTLFLHMYKETGSTWLNIPTIRSIHLAQRSSISLSDFDVPQLDIYMEDSCDANINTIKVSKLNIEGGKDDRLSMHGDKKNNSAVDSFRLKLGKNSEFRSFDVPYLQTDIKVDSLKILEMTGESLNVLKEIK